MYHEMVPAPSSKCRPNIVNLITKTWHEFNNVSKLWKWGQGQMSHAWLTIINMWTKYGKPRWYGNGETGPITKLDIVNAVIAAGKNNTYVSSSATVVADETKIGAQ